eukprot:CAMPEP_0178531168 /NCGR_PEP_ID=MMETSP0696-20121128/33276_1 /TAXON_ID=265572 /ORGANISM="Extubocellulus spinifer, Strain CCMP396" /LENGTH=55 /DNA_ID=CAMNT_0020163039 /DNA_START=351 /DNA_END=514 /DNA_ORIENTATION=+
MFTLRMHEGQSIKDLPYNGSEYGGRLGKSDDVEYDADLVAAADVADAVAGIGAAD